MSVVYQKTATGVYRFTFFGNGVVKVDEKTGKGWTYKSEIKDKTQIKKMIKTLENPDKKKKEVVSYKDKKIPSDFLTYGAKAGTASAAGTDDEGEGDNDVDDDGVGQADENQVTTKTSTTQTPKGKKPKSKMLLRKPKSRCLKLQNLAQYLVGWQLVEHLLTGLCNRQAQQQSIPRKEESF